MQLCRVDGNAVTTVHHPSLRGWRQLVCQPIDETGRALGGPILAIDCLGAGLHQRVIVTSDGKAVREQVGDPHTPLRYKTVAVVDDE